MWQQLGAFEADIKASFTNEPEPAKEGCPPQKRVHVLYAHYLARPNVERNVPPYKPIIELYKKCKKQHQEPTYQKVALDYLAGHYLWVRLPKVEIKALPAPRKGPPTIFDIPPTDPGGGTLIHFKDTNVDDPAAVKATIKTPLLIAPHRTFIEKYGEWVREVAHPPKQTHPLEDDDPVVGPAYPYLSQWTTAQRKALYDVQKQLGLPIDKGALPGVIQHESRGDPRAPYSATGLPRAGLIQVTKGANIAGFRTDQEVWDARRLSVEDQLHRMVVPMWSQMPADKRAGVDAKGAIRWNFLPNEKNQDPSFVIGVAEDKVGPKGETPDSKVSGLTRGSLYKNNPGLDPTYAKGAKDGTYRGYYTWKDVDDNTAATEKEANGKWITVSGRIVDSPYPQQRKLVPQPTAQSAPNRWIGDVDTSPRYPKKRVLCLSQAGSRGEHLTVDAFPPSEATVDLHYHTLSQDSELRLFCVAPGFVFATPGSDAKARERPQIRPEDLGADLKQTQLLDWQKDDPWFESTRNLGSGKKLVETSSDVLLGDLVKSRFGEGLQKLSDAPGVTPTEVLGQRYFDQLGRSRQVIFEKLTKMLGACESLQTWADNCAAWGINWWRLNHTDEGELAQILCYIYDFYPDAFARRFGYFGVGVWFSGRKATWEPLNTYQDAIVYRVPCCGPTIRNAMKAVLDDALKPPSFRFGSDTPPAAMKPLADATRMRRADTATKAFCYALTTAGEDRDVQRAMAQWMSYRISWKGPVGKPLLVAIEEFVETLKPSADKAIYEVRTLLGLGAEYVNKPTAEVLAAYKSWAHEEAKKAKPADEKAWIAKNFPLAETFSDDDADLAWIDWPTRCRDAGKVIEGVEKQGVNVARTERKASVFKGAGDLKPTEEA
jgi:hypothetical protein